MTSKPVKYAAMPCDKEAARKDFTRVNHLYGWNVPSCPRRREARTRNLKRITEVLNECEAWDRRTFFAGVCVEWKMPAVFRSGTILRKT